MVEILEFISQKMSKLIIRTDLDVFHYTPFFLSFMTVLQFSIMGDSIIEFM